MFVFFNKKIINSNSIASVTCMSDQSVKVSFFDKKTPEIVTGSEATILIKKLYPEFFGVTDEDFSLPWTIHNLVAHPVMQLCSLFGLSELGNKIHDATIPTSKY